MQSETQQVPKSTRATSRTPSATPWRTSWRTPWRAVAAAFAIAGAMLGAWASRIPAIVEKHQLSEAGLGILLLVMGIGALIAFPTAGKIVDRVGGARVTKALVVTVPVSLVIIGLLPNPYILGAFLFVFAMGFGALDVAMNSWATEVEKAAGRSIMASFHAMWSVGTGFGALVGAVAVWAGLSVAIHCLIFAVTLGALLLPFVWIPWQSDIQENPEDAPKGFRMPKRIILLCGLITLISGLGEGVAIDWSAIYLVEVLHQSEAMAALGFAVFSATMVVMRLSVDALVDRFGSVMIVRISGVSATIGLLLLVTTSSLSVALLGFVFMAIGFAALFPVVITRVSQEPGVPPGEAIATAMAMGYSAILIGPPLIGFVAEASSLRIAVALMLVGSVLVYFLAPVVRKHSGQD